MSEEKIKNKNEVLKKKNSYSLQFNIFLVYRLAVSFS